MESDEALKTSIRRWALKCAHKYRFAIPNKVIVNVLREFPMLEDEKGDLMENVRDICTEVNKMKDTDIARELHENSADETLIYE